MSNVRMLVHRLKFKLGWYENGYLDNTVQDNRWETCLSWIIISCRKWNYFQAPMKKNELSSCYCLYDNGVSELIYENIPNGSSMLSDVS